MYDVVKVSTHSRLKAAVADAPIDMGALTVSTHSRLKAAALMTCVCRILALFQHTAA